MTILGSDIDYSALYATFIKCRKKADFGFVAIKSVDVRTNLGTDHISL